MKVISSIYRREFATIRQLEKQCYSLLFPLGVLMIAAIVMFFTTILAPLAVILAVFSGAAMVGVFVWMINIQKASRTEIRCPYCNSLNSVFDGTLNFDCDICERPITFNEFGGPVPADGSLQQTAPTSVYEQ